MIDKSFSTPEKIQVLLAEYNALRAEVLERNLVLNQFLTISVAGGITIITIIAIGGNPTAALGIAITLFVIIPPIILLIFKILEFDTLAAAKRLRELENIINAIAQEELLVWETKNGIYSVGYKARFKAAASTGYFFLALALAAFLFSVYQASLYRHFEYVYKHVAAWLP